ncbi:hypothetical protein FXV91_13500 [Methanosarcina sp. DH2]|uniref:hypothetical protein n=1 Tax=Methanosarcina sp. DH2 TaxID=2605639 RepID=UPI001E5A8F36|nr:hypothetical protein [Methanosarcina sp. DH2]MCC4771142.1 hypothetical protein [Methanosarcina sp. DH2]
MSSKTGILLTDSCPEFRFSQQSTDQLPESPINPVEFDGFKMQTELCNLEPEQEERL